MKLISIVALLGLFCVSKGQFLGNWINHDHHGVLDVLDPLHLLGSRDPTVSSSGSGFGFGSGSGWGLGGSAASKQPCERDQLPKFKQAMFDFTAQLTKRAALYSKDHFAISPYTIWLSLAAIAEFAEASLQRDMFKALYLPEDKCIREKFYQMALQLEISGNDVKFDRNRALAIDDRVSISKEFDAFSKSSKILTYMKVPFNPENFEHVHEVMALPTKVSIAGHSIFLDRMDYGGIWTSAFTEGRMENAPFYDEFGKQIATVEYLRMKSRVRLAHIPIIDAKVLELPVGTDGRYTMLFTMGVRTATIRKILEMLSSSIIINILEALTLSVIPIDVAIPKFSLTSGLDARPILEDMGFASVFKDPLATKYVSDPPALPCCYLQKISVQVSNYTLGVSPDSGIISNLLNAASNTASDVVSAIGRNFLANRPFIYSLIDTKTKVTVFTGAYSYPQAV